MCAGSSIIGKFDKKKREQRVHKLRAPVRTQYRARPFSTHPPLVGCWLLGISMSIVDWWLYWIWCEGAKKPSAYMKIPKFLQLEIKNSGCDAFGNTGFYFMTEIWTIGCTFSTLYNNSRDKEYTPSPNQGDGGHICAFTHLYVLASYFSSLSPPREPYRSGSFDITCANQRISYFMHSPSILRWSSLQITLRQGQQQQQLGAIMCFDVVLSIWYKSFTRQSKRTTKMLYTTHYTPRHFE